MSEIHNQALNLLQKDQWEAAHRLIQDYSDPLSCRIHGLLHRIEGDTGNAGYWYRRAGVALPDNSFNEEIAVLFKLAGS